MSLQVIKLGGSLYRSAALADVLAWLKAQKRDGEAMAIVPGGGYFADAVRRQQRAQRLSDDAAHVLALAAMDSAAGWLANQFSDVPVVRFRDEVEGRDGSWLWAPRTELGESQVLPRTWHTTSDAIALWLAQATGAARLTVVKSCTPEAALGESSPSCAASPGAFSVARLVRLAEAGYLDATFPTLYAKAPVPLSFCSAQDLARGDETLASQRRA